MSRCNRDYSSLSIDHKAAMHGMGYAGLQLHVSYNAFVAFVESLQTL